MVSSNNATIGSSCLNNVISNTADETAQIYEAIHDAAEKSKLDERFILAIVIQESSGCVRVNTTIGSVRNPGLMQTQAGSGTCNDTAVGVQMRQPCLEKDIRQMIDDGVFGTGAPDGAGLVQLINQAPGNGTQKFYQAARLYNTGASASLKDLSGASGSTSCYASNVANRLMGWVKAPVTCKDSA